MKPIWTSKSPPPIDDIDINSNYEMGVETEKQCTTTASTSEVDSQAETLEQGLQQSEITDDEDNELVQLHAWRLIAIMLALCSGVLCVALDNTIIVTAIPEITDSFDFSGDIGWYGSVYLMTSCAFQLPFGRVYSFCSTKWVFLIALAIFEVGSATCGAAPNSWSFVLGRAVAGIGSAGVLSGAVLIITRVVRLERRSIYTSLIGGMYGVASLSGPSIGGLITDRLSWRFCFYINLPAGALAAVSVFLLFEDPARKTDALTWQQKANKLDLVGTSILLPAIICLILALQWGGSTYEWRSWQTLVPLVISCILTIIFAGIQFWRQENAVLPPRVLRRRSVWSSALFAVLVGAAFICMVYYIPVWFQSIKGMSATRSGIMSMSLTLAILAAVLISGFAVSFIGYYVPFCYVSTVFMAVGAGLCSTFSFTTKPAEWIGYQIIFGIGVGLATQQPLVAVQTVLPSDDIPTGTAIVLFSEKLGGAVFASVAQSVFSNRLIHEIAINVPAIQGYAVLSAGATEIRDRFDPKLIHGILLAYNDAITQVFYVSVAMSALAVVPAVFMEWRSVKEKRGREARGQS